MADILRRPLEIGRRDPPRIVAVVFAVASLLTTTLAPVATLPPGAQSFPTQSHRHVRFNADTSQDTPKTLTADAQLPIGKARTERPPERPKWVLPADTTQDSPQTVRPDAQLPVRSNLHHTPPDRARNLPASTTVGTSKTLTADKQAPVGFSSGQVATPEARRTVTDTTLDTPLPLIAVVVAAPFNNPPIPQVDWRRWFADTSQDTAKVLTADAQAPVGTTRSESAPERSRWLPADTTQDTPQTVRPDAQAPVSNLQQTAPDRARNLPASTAAGTAKALTADAQAPAGAENGQVSTPDLRRSVVNTGTGTSAPLIAAIILPPPAGLNAPHFTAERVRWLPASTAAGTAKALTADAQAPVANAPTLQFERRGVWNDATHGTAVVLLQVPFSNPPTLLVERRWSGAETSRRALLDVAAPVSNAPTARLDRRWEPSDSTRGTPKTLTRDAQAPVFNVQVFQPDRLRWLPTDTSAGLAEATRPLFVAVDRIYVVTAQGRTYLVTAELRSYSINAQRRTLIA